MKPQDSLRQSADVFEERGRVYGEAYKRFGPVFEELFPNGISVSSPDTANRLGVLVQIISKLVRYAENFEAGGHDDSLLDLPTYAAMLRELDAEARQDRADAAEALDAFADMPKPPEAFPRDPELAFPSRPAAWVAEMEIEPVVPRRELSKVEAEKAWSEAQETEPRRYRVDI